MLHMPFKELLNKYGKNNRNGIIHVGAHIGEEIDLYKELGFERILLFEPLKKPFDQIPTSIGVYKVNAAVGSKKDRVSMYLAENTESSSILKPKHHLVAHPDVIFSGKEDVDVVSLDEWFSENEFGLSANDFSCLILDAQGYEGKILVGAENTLRRIQVVYSEVNIKDLYEENTHMNFIDYKLSHYGLSRKETWISHSGSGEAIYV